MLNVTAVSEPLVPLLGQNGLHPAHQRKAYRLEKSRDRTSPDQMPWRAPTPRDRHVPPNGHERSRRKRSTARRTDVDGRRNDPADHDAARRRACAPAPVFFRLDGDAPAELGQGLIEAARGRPASSPRRTSSSRSTSRRRPARAWTVTGYQSPAARRRTKSTSLRESLSDATTVQYSAPAGNGGLIVPTRLSREPQDGLRLGPGTGRGRRPRAAAGEWERDAHHPFVKRSGTSARSRPAENDVGPTGQRSGGFRAVAARSMASTTGPRFWARRRRADWR